MIPPDGASLGPLGQTVVFLASVAVAVLLGLAVGEPALGLAAGAALGLVAIWSVRR